MEKRAVGKLHTKTKNVGYQKINHFGTQKRDPTKIVWFKKTELMPTHVCVWQSDVRFAHKTSPLLQLYSKRVYSPPNVSTFTTEYFIRGCVGEDRGTNTHTEGSSLQASQWKLGQAEIY